MKKLFEMPEMTVVAYKIDDVIATSKGNDLPEDEFTD